MSDLKINPATLEYAKQENARRGKRRAIASVVGLLLVAGIASAGYWAWSSYQKSAKATLAQQLASAPDARDKLRDAVRSGQLTREQAWDAGREAWEKREQETIDGYFKTPAAQRDEYLDKMIDEMQKRMAEWQRDRPTTGPATRPDRPRGDGPTSRPTDAEREARGRARADNQSPLQRAQQSEFRAAMMARMAARGIQMRGPFGGGGRGGPGGGGRGPGGGGGGGGR
jgi:hypothetical protein